MVTLAKLGQQLTESDVLDTLRSAPGSVQRVCSEQTGETANVPLVAPPSVKIRTRPLAQQTAPSGEARLACTSQSVCSRVLGF